MQLPWKKKQGSQPVRHEMPHCREHFSLKFRMFDFNANLIFLLYEYVKYLNYR